MIKKNIIGRQFCSHFIHIFMRNAKRKTHTTNARHFQLKLRIKQFCSPSKTLNQTIYLPIEDIESNNFSPINHSRSQNYSLSTQLFHYDIISPYIIISVLLV